jgi:hypothetical protein
MFEMDDLPYKSGKSPAERAEGAKREWEAELKKRAASEKRQATRAANTKRRPTTVKRTQTARVGSRPVNKLPPMCTPGEQPRDNLGRFASKTGQVLKGAIFGTAHVVGGTVAAAQVGYKTVKGAHKRRKKAAGHGMTVLAGKPKRRRRKKAVKAKPVVKQGLLSKMFGKRK